LALGNGNERLFTGNNGINKALQKPGPSLDNIPKLPQLHNLRVRKVRQIIARRIIATLPRKHNEFNIVHSLGFSYSLSDTNIHIDSEGIISFGTVKFDVHSGRFYFDEGVLVADGVSAEYLVHLVVDFYHALLLGHFFGYALYLYIFTAMIYIDLLFCLYKSSFN
jgi:hypothetical protein